MLGRTLICDGKEIKVCKSETVKENTLNIESGKTLSVDTRCVAVKTDIDALRLVHIEPRISVDRGEYL